MTVEEMIRKKEETGYSLKKISESSGVPVVTLQKIFAGKTEHPRRNTLNAIEKVFLLKKEEYSMDSSFDFSGCGDGLRRKNSLWEVVDGMGYELDIPETMHQEIVSYIHMCLYQYVRTKEYVCKIYTFPISVYPEDDTDTILRPDLFLVSEENKIRKNGVYTAPDFVLEVLSRETRKKDMSVKLQKYVSSGVKEYWMLDPDQEKLVVYNFMEEDFFPCVYTLQEKIPVALWNGELKIDLEPVKSILEKRKTTLENNV